MVAVMFGADTVKRARDLRHGWIGRVSAAGAWGGRRPGFTLIELLVVVVIIGILASIAIPKFQSTKGKANAASIVSDLKNLASAQEAYFYDHDVYASNLSFLQFKSSNGVTVAIDEATTSGWSATATHPSSFPLTCALYIGGAAPKAPATVEGQIGCQ